MTRGAGTERELRDVAYASGSPAQKLDLHLPRVAGPFPVVLWVHGGAWRSGDKALGAHAPQRRLLERGWALASVNYRLSSEATFPAQLHDVRAAVRWLRTHAAALGLDAGRMAAWGAPGRFLCDSCRYDYRDACKRPERPNATFCEDYRRR